VKIDFPADHKSLVAIKGGPTCANCRFSDAKSHTCSADGYVKAEIKLGDFEKKSGDGTLPPDQKLEDMCSDWWAPEEDPREKLINTIKAKRGR